MLASRINQPDAVIRQKSGNNHIRIKKNLVGEHHGFFTGPTQLSFNFVKILPIRQFCPEQIIIQPGEDKDREDRGIRFTLPSRLATISPLFINP